MADDLRELVAGMNALARGAELDLRATSNASSSPATARSPTRSARTPQMMAIRARPRATCGDRVRVVKPHRMLDPGRTAR